MKGLKFCALVLSAGMLLSSCGGNMNNTGKGSLIGAGGCLLYTSPSPRDS